MKSDNAVYGVLIIFQEAHSFKLATVFTCDVRLGTDDETDYSECN